VSYIPRGVLLWKRRDTSQYFDGRTREGRWNLDRQAIERIEQTIETITFALEDAHGDACNHHEHGHRELIQETGHCGTCERAEWREALLTAMKEVTE
jgi:hypothetical protein